LVRGPSNPKHLGWKILLGRAFGWRRHQLANHLAYDNDTKSTKITEGIVSLLSITYKAAGFLACNGSA
jgi:hypothetical protein